MQIFHRSTNTLSRLSIFGALGVVGLGLWGLAVVNRSAWVTHQDEAREQPVQFSHKHHVGELGIDCRYCHTQVERAAYAGIPPTKTCMNCHAQIWTQSPILAPVRDSLKDDVPLEWRKVHDLPDYVYFDHSVHVAKGVGCESCHGRVDRMNQVWQASSLHMEWCLDCHRHPERHVRPRDAVFEMGWTPDADREALGLELMKANDIHTRTDCSTCHR